MDSLLASSVIAAVVSAVTTAVLFELQGRRSRTDRQRELFGDAFAAVVTYREFPFIVRRRRHDQPEAERERISARLSEVQTAMNVFQGRLAVESPAVGMAYANLVRETRKVAGASIREAWDVEPITRDGEIHARFDLTSLEAVDSAFLLAVRMHFAPIAQRFLAATRPVFDRIAGWRRGTGR